MTRSKMQSCPVPFHVKHPKTDTELPSCLTVGTTHLGSNSSLGVRHTITFPSDPKRLNFDSSDQITVSQNPSGLFSMSFAYFNRFPRLTLLTNGFFRATRPSNPASCALFRIVLTFNEFFFWKQHNFQVDVHKNLQVFFLTRSY